MKPAAMQSSDPLFFIDTFIDVPFIDIPIIDASFKGALVRIQATRIMSDPNSPYICLCLLRCVNPDD
jgi:hypothetical protein